MTSRKALLVCLTFQLGCASITGSSKDVLRVNAAPDTAMVRVNGIVRGRAPMSVAVPKQGQTFVEVTAPGHQSVPCSTQMSASPGYIAADIALCVVFFPIGCISFIDAAGAWNTLVTPQCDAVLPVAPAS